jgi:hypothetical protein
LHELLWRKDTAAIGIDFTQFIKNLRQIHADEFTDRVDPLRAEKGGNEG